MVLVWVLTIIELKASRHNADMYWRFKGVKFETLPFESRKQNLLYPSSLLTPV